MGVLVRRGVVVGDLVLDLLGTLAERREIGTPEVVYRTLGSLGVKNSSILDELSS